ncbi:TPA: recombinase RecT, partial [Clostridioides difficile]|nr:recombinase RecT [Clostridioides difficile]
MSMVVDESESIDVDFEVKESEDTEDSQISAEENINIE